MKLIPLLACTLLATPALAAPYTFTAMPADFSAISLNSVGQIAGVEQPNLSPNSTTSAIYNVGSIGIGVPLSTISGTVTALDNAGDVAGIVQGVHGAPFATFAPAGGLPAATFYQQIGNAIDDVNTNRQFVGRYTITGPAGQPVSAGYISNGVTYTSLLPPGAQSAEARGINALGTVVGTFNAAPGSTQPGQQGFLFDGASYTTLDRPGATSTTLTRINDAGEIIGTDTDSTGAIHGFTEAGGVFTDLIGPDGTAFLPSDINDQGQLVGSTTATPGFTYLATPTSTPIPEPSTLPLAAVSLTLLAALRRRQR